MLTDFQDRLDDILEEHAKVCYDNKVLKDALKAVVNGATELDENSLRVVLDKKDQKALDKAVRQCL